MFTKSSTGFAVVAIVMGLLCINVVQPQLASAAGPQTSEVCLLPPGDDCDVVGSARLVRTPHGISFNLRTTELDPHTAYTVWFVVFNFPEFCLDEPCNPRDDSGNPDVLNTVLYGTGHVVGRKGNGNFGAHLAVGDTSGDTFPPVLPGDIVGLVNPMGAEVHIVVRSHGPKIPGMVNEQISTFNGVGCMDLVPPDNNPFNPDNCEDQQFAVFLSP